MEVRWIVSMSRIGRHDSQRLQDEPASEHTRQAWAAVRSSFGKVAGLHDYKWKKSEATCATLPNHLPCQDNRIFCESTDKSPQ